MYRVDDDRSEVLGGRMLSFLIDESISLVRSSRASDDSDVLFEIVSLLASLLSSMELMSSLASSYV